MPLPKRTLGSGKKSRDPTPDVLKSEGALDRTSSDNSTGGRVKRQRGTSTSSGGAYSGAQADAGAAAARRSSRSAGHESCGGGSSRYQPGDGTPGDGGSASGRASLDGSDRKLTPQQAALMQLEQDEEELRTELEWLKSGKSLFDFWSISATGSGKACSEDGETADGVDELNSTPLPPLRGAAAASSAAKAARLSTRAAGQAAASSAGVANSVATAAAPSPAAPAAPFAPCLLYTSDAADDTPC
eukprot:6199869-Pleurochrysis_carterae.AAC.2